MGATQSSDFQFKPKVWQDHIQAFFRRKLVYGALALQDDTLKAQPGDTVNFPFFKKIGDAEEPAEDQGLQVDNLSDDSFSATVKEVGKAVGVKRAALIKSATSQERNFKEAQEQIARVHAEKVDRDLLVEIQTASVQGFLAAGAGDVMTIRTLNLGRIKGFGDKHSESVATFMHSLQFLDMMNDSTAGFLKADANDPLIKVAGFEGRILGMAIITADSIPKRVGQIGGKDAYDAFIIKNNAYGILTKVDMEVDSDFDILHREWVFAGTQWYAVKNFHAKIASDDLKINKISTTVAN